MCEGLHLFKGRVGDVELRDIFFVHEDLYWVEEVIFLVSEVEEDPGFRFEITEFLGFL
jgi:hypothetical protein